MIHLFLVVFLNYSSAIAESSKVSFDCSKADRIIAEMIEAELSGIRDQSGVSTCLDQRRFKSVMLKHQQVGDPYLLKPEYVIAKGSSYKVETVNDKAGDLVEVEFSYVTSANLKIKDSLEFVKVFGPRVKRKGCAMILREPAHFVMREECLNR